MAVLKSPRKPHRTATVGPEEASRRVILERAGWQVVAEDGGEGELEPEGDPDLASVKGIGPELAEALANAGLGSVEALRAAPDEALLAIPGIGAAKLKQLRAVL